MAERITARMVEAQLERLGAVVDQPGRLRLQHGAPSAGRAWRLFVEKESGGLGPFPGIDSDGYLGDTTREAYRSLRMLVDGIALGRGIARTLGKVPLDGFEHD